MASTDPYRLLAGRLGYPDSQYLRRILEFLMPKKVAEIVVELPTPVHELAQKFQMAEEEINSIIQAMHQKGIIIPTSRGHFFARSIKDLQDATRSKEEQESAFQQTLSGLWQDFVREVEKKELTFGGLTVGEGIGPFELVVTMEEAEKVLRSISTKDPWYWKDTSGSARIAPATLGSRFYYALLCKKYDLTGPQHATGLHLSQEDEFFSPIRVGTRLRLRAKIADKKVSKGRNYATFEVEATDDNGALVAKYRSIVEILIS